MDAYPWQQEQMKRLTAIIQQKRMPHALLLSGPEGIGLKRFALVFAKQVLCPSKNSSTDLACEKCKSCNLFDAKSHPDLKLIEPEIAGKAIKIEQIRELINYVSFKSFSGDIKIVIIKPADAMNRNTANALLKTLEEPPSQSAVILLSNYPSKIPITIKSRCQKIDFRPTFDEITTEWLNKNLEDTKFSSELLLRLAGGGPLKAIELASENFLESRHELLGHLEILGKKTCDPSSIVTRWDEFGAKNTVFCLMKIIHDMIQLKLSPKKASIVNIDLREDLQGAANTLDLLKLIRGYEFISLKYKELFGMMNYNTLSILEEIVLFWKNNNNSTLNI